MHDVDGRDAADARQKRALHERKQFPMDPGSPYLFERRVSLGRGGQSLAAVSDDDGEVVDFTVDGPWDRQLHLEAWRGLRKCLAEHPSAVIVDLRRLQDPVGGSVSAWMAAGRAAEIHRPPVQLVLSVSPDTALARRLQRLGARHFLPVYDTVAAARAAVLPRLPLTHRLRLHLPPEHESAVLARNLVGDACQSWQLPQFLHPSRLIISELVMNVVEHARTDMEVLVSLRGSTLRLAVRDGDPALPRLLEPAFGGGHAPLDERGHGLRMIAAAAAAWGALPTANGKVVWATVRPRVDF